MEDDQRLRLHFLIADKVGGKLLHSPDPVEPLPLGSYYAKRMSALNTKKIDLFRRLIADLSAMEETLIIEAFDTAGNPVSDNAKEWRSKYRTEIKDTFGNLRDWFFAPFFATDDLADFEHWARADYLTIDEVVWLSVGLEPKHKFRDAISQPKRQQKSDKVAEYIGRHKEMIRRKFDPYNYDQKPDRFELRCWIEETKLQVHPSFLAMLPATQRIGQSKGDTTGTTALQADANLDGRERVTMAKIIAAIAVDAYGYDPKAKRSEIPKEIEGITDRLGLQVSRETIRKYLKEGSELLPPDWKPE